MNGLDLFSGIGGISEALSPWVRTVAYCENERHAQAELLSRMSKGEIHTAPIWDDATTLRGKDLPATDIITAGFPCQDISVAGRRAGMAGKRSGLFFEIPRLIREIRPAFVFLENTPGVFVPPAQRKKEPTPLGIVASEMAALGYDCRWSVLSALDVGAPHLRERWWLLGYSNRGRRQGNVRGKPRQKSEDRREELVNTSSIRRNGRGTSRERIQGRKQTRSQAGPSGGDVADAESKRVERRRPVGEQEPRLPSGEEVFRCHGAAGRRCDWSTEPNVGRVAHGVPLRNHRLIRLGGTVVPQCAREAFQRLMGIDE